MRMYLTQGANRTLIVLLFATILCLAIACEQPSQSATNHNADSSNTTSQPLPTPNATELAYMWRVSGMSPTEITVLLSVQPTKYADLQTITAGFEQKATMIAQTPWPTSSPASATSTIGVQAEIATSVRTTGIIPCGAAAPGDTYVYRSCWQGVYNGGTISVVTATKRNHANGKGDTAPLPPYEPVLLFFDTSLDNSLGQQARVYKLPSQIGNAIITSASGTQLTLSQSDGFGKLAPVGQTLIFDLATRQFETVSGTPIPTTPVPTPSP